MKVYVSWNIHENPAPARKSRKIFKQFNKNMKEYHELQAKLYEQ